MSPLPTQMRDRWASRAEPAEGQGTVYWHILLGGFPEARAAADDARSSLCGLPGLHFTPTEWLHSTLFVVGSTKDLESPELLAEVSTNVQAAAHKVDLIEVSLGRTLYHPEALMLAIEPAEPLRELRDVVIDATRTTVRDLDVRPSSTWIPHMTVAYSTTRQPAAPIIGAFGRSVPTQRLTLDQVALVVQWGPERRWDWESAGVIDLGNDAGRRIRSQMV